MSANLAPDSAAPWELLARHLAGEATPAEREQLRAWVAAKPERLGLLTDVTRAWERAGAAPVASLFNAADVDAAWLRFKPLMQVSAGHAVPAAETPTAETTIEQTPSTPAKIIPLRPATETTTNPTAPWLRIAAVLALLVGSVYAFRVVRETLLPAEPVQVAAGATKRQLTLPDGSRVWLNRNSTLTYTPKFDTGREVTLVGEAFFEVRKNPNQPFTVLTAASRTRVLGTSFNVRAYAAEDSVEVAVLTGRVALASRTGPDSVLLPPGTRGVVHTPTGPATAPTTSVTPALRQTATLDANFRAWQTDQLVFDNAPLRHVVRTLRATYGTRVTVADDKLLNCRFTGTFRQPEPAQVLTVVSVATNATLRGDATAGYELSGAGCP